MLKVIKESSFNAYQGVQNALDSAILKCNGDEEIQELLQNVIGICKEMANDRGLLVESKQLNEDIVSALKILFDNSTLDNVKKVAQAKQIAKSLGIDEKELISESKKLNESEFGDEDYNEDELEYWIEDARERRSMGEDDDEIWDHIYQETDNQYLADDVIASLF